MKKTNHKIGNTLLQGFNRKSLWLLALALLGINLITLAQDRIQQHKELTGPAAAKIVRGASSLKEGSNTSYPAYVRLNASETVRAESFVSWLRQARKIPDNVSFRLLRQDKDKSGIEYYRYVQTYRGVPIDKAHYVVHAREGKVIAFNGLALDVPAQLPAVPRLTEAQALKMALERTGATKYKWEGEFWTADLRKRTGDPNATYYPKGELCWTVGDDNKTFRLAWKFDIESSSPDKLQRIYVDANTGALIQKLPMESNCAATTVNTVFNGNQGISTQKYTPNDYRLLNDCDGGGAEFWIRDWNSATLTPNPIEIENTTNTWTTNDERFGGTVLWLTERAFDYWKSEHSRDSYDDAFGDITGYINAKFNCGTGCVSDFNASMSFTGGTMKVGAGSGFADGYATVDIIGHEFTHAVTGATSQLVYADESGALNESFSDIFGEANENYVFGSNDWLLGDERQSGFIRSMSNPNAKNDPDTYLGTYWYTGTADDGGVHTNSGVQNFWFYLLTVGGSGTNDNSDAYSVSGIGLGKASDIAYSNQISLSPDDGYAEARDGAIQAAITLYGACSDEVKQTTNAWHAVGVGNKFIDATVSVTSDYNGRDVSCFGACDGSAKVTVIGGDAPTISWSPGGATTPTISGLCKGVYTVTVTDGACSVVRNVTILDAPQLFVSPAATTNYNGYNISCNGGNDGAAAANATGGTPPYSYNWSPGGQTTATAIGLTAGNYTVTVTDANGCMKAGNVTLTEPPVLSTTVAPTTNYNGYNVRCHGGSDGAAKASPIGGVPPYTYSWSPGGQTTQTATGLMALNYTVTVTDDNGCTASANTTLTEPPPLTIDAGTNQTVYYGYPDSACAKLTATGIGGGVPPYTLSWSTGSGAASITVCPITTTTYYVTVTDLNGCTWTDSVKVCVIDVRCGNHLDKVQLCHNTGSNNNPTNTLCVALPAAKNHIAHGDQLAACGTIKTCFFGAMARLYNASGNNTSGYLTAFPNPLADNTTVRFQVPTDQHVDLKLFDLSGRMIANLYTGEAKEKNPYDLQLDARRIAAGVYFLILKTDAGESYSHKLIITK